MCSKKDASDSILKRLFLRPWIGLHVGKSHGWRYDEFPWMDRQIFRSSTIAPALLYYSPSMGLCKICTSTIHGCRIVQRASTAVRLFLCCFIPLVAISTHAWADTACPGARYDETTSIRYIHDGDTLHLRDGRKVRLIGINTPEVAHGDKTAEPFSAQAKNALIKLFGDKKTISLIYGKEKLDRYERLLAHAFTSDGTNIQATLLEQGLARAVTFPPNTQFSTCYQQQERKARCTKTGLWKKTKPLMAKNLDDTHIGFQLVKGKLKNISINKKGIWLKLDNKLTVGIRPNNQQLFDIEAIYELLDENVVVRGWLNKSKKDSPYYMRIRHPSSMQAVTAFACD
jgi:endonuclease YncB( thermonuclease family)